MRLQIPVRRVERLPDATQIRLAVHSPCRPVGIPLRLDPGGTGKHQRHGDGGRRDDENRNGDANAHTLSWKLPLTRGARL